MVKVKVSFESLSVKPCGFDINYDLGVFTFKYAVIYDERNDYPIQYGTQKAKVKVRVVQTFETSLFLEYFLNMILLS